MASSREEQSIYAAGIDVQIRRKCPIAVIRPDGSSAAAVWADEPKEVRSVLRDTLHHEGAGPEQVVIGIDAPRMPLPSPRPYYWVGADQTWRPRTSKQRGLGRHCEVAISAHGLAKPQWTPLKGEAPPWMERGFALYAALNDLGKTYEAFPSASYRQLRSSDVTVQVALSGFFGGPKDMMDAYVAAVTTREYALGRGEAIGDGDGLGAIVLPRPVRDRIEGVMGWPGGVPRSPRGTRGAGQPSEPPPGRSD